jgi:hypothetical protein
MIGTVRVDALSKTYQVRHCRTECRGGFRFQYRHDQLCGIHVDRVERLHNRFLLKYSRVIPLSYSVNAFRSTMMGFPPGFPEVTPIQVEIVIVTAFGVIMPFLGYYLYRKAEDQVRRSGSLSSF